MGKTIWKNPPLTRRGQFQFLMIYNWLGCYHRHDTDRTKRRPAYYIYSEGNLMADRRLKRRYGIGATVFVQPRVADAERQEGSWQMIWAWKASVATRESERGGQSCRPRLSSTWRRATWATLPIRRVVRILRCSRVLDMLEFYNFIGQLVSR